MRCFFHFVSESESMRDTEGLEVMDVDQAHAEALETLQSLIQEDEEAAAMWSGWRLDVCDASGRELFSFSLDQPATVH
jgi:hypothetical protein